MEVGTCVRSGRDTAEGTENTQGPPTSGKLAWPDADGQGLSVSLDSEWRRSCFINDESEPYCSEF